MKKVTEGHIIQPTPLDTMFSMKELHGTLSQKYDAINGLYIADRTLTPFVLKPEFSVNDKTGKIPNGDYTAQLINCVWTVKCKVKGNAPVAGKDYVVNEETKELTLKCNLDPDTSGEISFSAEFIDSRRGDVLKSFWRGELSCVSEIQWRVSLRTEWPQRTNLIPWKSRGVFSIPVQLMNGDKNHPDGSSVYKWQVFENEKGNYTGDTVWNAMKSAAQDPDPDAITSNTQWSVSYNNTDLSADIVIRRNWNDVTHCELKNKVTTPVK